MTSDLQTAYAELLRTAAAWDVPEFYNMAADVADRHPDDRLALIFVDHTGRRTEVHWKELRAQSNRIASALAAGGVVKGDRVAVLLPQRPQTPGAYLGVLRTGAILVTMSHLWADEQIEYRLSDSGARTIVTDAAGLKRIPASFAGEILNIEDPALQEFPDTFETVQTRADDPALIFYTSGTTGPAKGIVHAHRTLLGHNEFFVCHGLTPDSVFYGAGEWAWSMAKLMGPLRIGATHVVYMPKAGLEPEGLLKTLSEEGVTHSLMNPTFLRIIRDAVPDAGTRYPQRFEVVCCSNEPLDEALFNWFRDQFGIELFDYYGSTESYPLIGNFPGVPVKPGSMGRPLPGWDVHILDENEQEVAQGETGEICLRTRSNPQFPLGYWNRPEASEESFGGDWYHTKDQAYMDEDGYVWYLGRTDDVIKTSGYRVGPHEIEGVLRRHPAVQDCGVVGLPDPTRGQALKAWIQLVDGTSPSDELATELQNFVKQHYSRFAYPRSIEFIDELPRSATGKVQRAELRRRDLG